MSVLNRIKQVANQFVEETDQDFNEAQKGGGVLIPEGYAFSRLIEYIELGKHISEFDGKPKPPTLCFQLGFALFGEDYEYEDGFPRIIRTFPINLLLSEKAKAYKLFKKLNYKGNFKHFAQMLGEGFLTKIVHVENKSKVKTARIDLDGFLPPIDVVTRKPHPIPEVKDDSIYKLFLWDRPTKEDWDSLYIEGNWDNGDSKNFIQNRIMEASDYVGSPLQSIVESGSVESVSNEGASPKCEVPSFDDADIPL
jgi:hypothetical protein